MDETMVGKTVLVTGATDGIGRATAEGLARLGARVIAVARNPAKGDAVVNEIRDSTGNAAVEVLIADLASQKSIRQAASELGRRVEKLDVLINQAGVYVEDRRVTEDGLELMFAVNHLAYFLLTNLLLEQLAEGAPSRVINGTGGIEGLGKIDFDDLQGERKFKPFAALARSKLANVLFTYELDRRVSGRGVRSNAFHPGGVKTGLGAGQGGLMGVLMRLSRFVGSTPAEAAKIPIHLATSPDLEGVGGRYYNMMKPGTSSARSRDEALAKRLWEVSAELTGLSS
jgi:NAD(P)-dependent dehydrogenase (short-subunit alcohol dehydrogenase family)